LLAGVNDEAAVDRGAADSLCRANWTLLASDHSKRCANMLPVSASSALCSDQSCVTRDWSAFLLRWIYELRRGIADVEPVNVGALVRP
jgi:hypothetical protein